VGPGIRVPCGGSGARSTLGLIATPALEFSDQQTNETIAEHARNVGESHHAGEHGHDVFGPRFDRSPGKKLVALFGSRWALPHDVACSVDRCEAALAREALDLVAFCRRTEVASSLRLSG
jgi:hypothetical protein